MATLSGLISFSPGTPAVASQVNSNFSTVKNFVEAITTGVNIDAGSIGFAKLASDVTNRLVPVGTVVAYAGATAPTGWLLCNGTSTTGYPSLAALVGATTPDFRGRTLVGQSGSVPFNGALLSVLGSTASVSAHSHTVSGTAAETGSHSHSITVDGVGDHVHPSSATGFLANQGFDWTPPGPLNKDWSYDVPTGAAGAHSHTASSAPAGQHSHSVSGTAAPTGDTHGNVQPSALVNYIIKHD